MGAGIEEALHAGFAEIHSIELAERFCTQCQILFAGHSNVHVWLGDSSTLLEQIIAPMQEPITFWLDGHWSGGETAKGTTYTPLVKELEAIQKHPIKTHTILIDDVRCFGTFAFDDLALEEVVQKILEINPDYVISFQDGFQANDILIAQIPSKSLPTLFDADFAP